MFIVLGLFSPGSTRRPRAKKAKGNAASASKAAQNARPAELSMSAEENLDGILAALLAEIDAADGDGVDNYDSGLHGDHEDDCSASVNSEASGDSATSATRAAVADAACKEGNASADANVVKEGISFDAAAYKAALGDMPYHVAVTTLFVRYAQLVSRLTGHYHCKAPMTVQEAEAVGALAKNFVLGYLVPVLGQWYSTKVHKLLAHVIEAILEHGALKNGDTSTNEALHGNDKRRYCRTSGDGDAFRTQMLRVGQGSLELRARLEQEAADSNGWFEEESDDNGTAGCPTARVSGVAPTSRQPAFPRRALDVTVNELSQRRGLCTLAQALGSPVGGTVTRVTNSYTFSPRMSCCAGGHPKQHLRATPMYRGLPWYDGVAYRLPGDPPTLVRFGEARAIVRAVGGEVKDVVLVSRMDVCESAPGCPLVGAGCTRLCWSMVLGADWPSLHAVPLSSVLRMEHIVQDCDQVTRAHGIAATPRTIRDSAMHRREARFFVNVFYPWP